MTTVIGVRFRKVGKVYYFDPAGLNVEKNMDVIVETARGVEFCRAVLENHEVADDRIVQPLRRVLRIATEDDKKTMMQNEAKEAEAFELCRKKVEEHGLEMALVSAEYTFDLNKLLFYFTANGRVDFRELVKDLAALFHTRIELRQIGVRDEAKMVGGLGVCGKPLCCATFLDDFQPVSINMAKDQNLSLSPTKISGTCGRLMCCLKFEQEAYEDLIRTTPSVDSIVKTPAGNGTVIECNLLRSCCKVRLDDGQDTIKTFPKQEMKIIKSGHVRRERGGRDKKQQQAQSADRSRTSENAAAKE